MTVADVYSAPVAMVTSLPMGPSLSSEGSHLLSLYAYNFFFLNSPPPPPIVTPVISE